MYPPSASQLAQSRLDLRMRGRAVRDARALAANEEADNRMRAQRVQLVQGGALPTSLPPVNDGMSPALRAETQARLNMAGGMSPTAARMPATNANPAATGVFDGLPFQTQRMDNLRAAIAPTLAQRAADAKDVAAVGALAGKNGTVNVPEGSVSVRQPTWDEQIVQKYPAIGVAGSPENKKFVDWYNANGKDKDPAFIHANADRMFGVDPRTGKAATTADSIPTARPADISQPSIPATPVPPLTAYDRGQMARQGVISAAQGAANSLTAGASGLYQGAIGGPLNTIRNGVEAFKGFIGSPSSVPADGQAQSSGDAAGSAGAAGSVSSGISKPQASTGAGTLQDAIDKFPVNPEDDKFKKMVAFDGFRSDEYA